MKILFLSAWFPYPPNNGARIRTYNLIKSLSKRHDVYLVSLMQDDCNPDDATHLGGICTCVSLHHSRWFRKGTIRAMLGFFSSRPRSFVDTFDPAIKAAVEKAVASVSPDVIVASTLGVVEYVPDGVAIPCILEEHNCEFAVLRRDSRYETDRLRRFRYELGWKKFARWEAEVCRRFDAVCMVSDEDARAMQAFAPDLDHIAVVPNGVDTDYYAVTERAQHKDALIYNGALTYQANLDAVRFYAHEINPILRNMRPGVTLSVTGSTDGTDLSGIRDCPGIALTGYVDDIRTALRSSSVCVVPLRRGGGSRLKILEAMASGVPVVSTTIGIEGIAAKDGRDALIADSPAQFAEAVCRILDDCELAGRLAGNARALVEECYSWDTIGEQFTDLVEAVGRTNVE